MLVHGDFESPEYHRARGLTSEWSQEHVRFLMRDRNRLPTALAWWRDLRQWQPAVLYVLNVAIPGALVAPLWGRIHGRPFILDTGDVVHEMAVRSGVTPPWKRPALKGCEVLAQRFAKAIVVRGTLHARHMMESGYSRVSLIRDGYRVPEHTDPQELAELRRRLGLEKCHVAGLLGSLVYSPRLRMCYGWDLIHAIARLRDLPLKGLIVGDGPGRSWLEQEAARAGVRDRTVFTGRVPYRDVARYLQLMDCALSTQTNNLPGQVRTTGKLPEYMASGRFVLASRVGEAALLLPEIMLLDYQGDVDRSYPERLAMRIRQVLNDPVLFAEREKLPAIAERHCSYAVLRREFTRLILDAAGKSG
jgi:hypothetical protein